MRVLYIGKYHPPFSGGIENFMADLLPVQARDGVETLALVHEHRRSTVAVPEGVVERGVRLYRAPAYGRLLYAPVSPQFPFWLRRVIRQSSPDVLHLHLPNTSAFWVLALPQARRILWVIHWHSDVVASQHDRRLSAAYRVYRPRPVLNRRANSDFLWSSHMR